MAQVPPRTATDAYLSHQEAQGTGRTLAVRFDADLGELVRGHRVVARGLEFAGTGTLMHHEFVPGIPPGRPLRDRVGLQGWALRTTDDVGTDYTDPDSGAFGSAGGPAPTHGVRDLGGHTPSTAEHLWVEINPADGWRPPDGWVRRLGIDLATGRVACDRDG